MRWQLPLAIVAALFLISAGSFGTAQADDAAKDGAAKDGAAKGAADGKEAKGNGDFKGKFGKGQFGKGQFGKGGFGKGGFGKAKGGGAGKEQFMKRFDKNGDGKIDDGEKQALREAFANKKKQQQ